MLAQVKLLENILKKKIGTKKEMVILRSSGIFLMLNWIKKVTNLVNIELMWEPDIHGWICRPVPAGKKNSLTSEYYARLMYIGEEQNRDLPSC